MFKLKFTSVVLVLTILVTSFSFYGISYAANVEMVMSNNILLRNIISTHGQVGFRPLFKASSQCEAGWSPMPGETLERIRLYREASSVSGRDVFFQFETYAPSDMKSYVYEIDVYPVQFSSNADHVCSLFNAFDSDESIVPIKIQGSSLVYDSEKLLTVECNKWTKFSAIVDAENFTFDLYVNRTLVKANLELGKNVTPSTIRVGINSGYTLGEMYFDNIKLYEGSSFRDIPLYLSNAENTDDVSSILGDACVFMTEKNNIYINGFKTTYTALNFDKLYENDVLYVTVPAASAALGCTNSELVSYLETKNDTSYVALTEALADNFEKNLYSDGRGWVCISSSDLNLSNNIVNIVSDENSDVIDRYMQFDSPSGDEIYNAIKTNSYKKHPRIWVTDDDVNKLRSDIVSNQFKKDGADTTINMANQLLGEEPVEYEITDGIRLFNSCLEVRNRIMTLSAAYLISDEGARDKYAAKIWEEVENACNWKDWNLSNHYLDSGKIGPGIALAYDVCYDYFTNEQKAFIRQSLKEKYLYYAAASYAGNTKQYLIGKNNTNWGAVCNGSILLVCLATMDEEDENSEYTSLTKYLAKEALQGMEYLVSNVYPDGAWGEGLGYFEWMVEYISWSAKALVSTCGSDYGLIRYPGVSNIPLFALYIQTINNGYFNFNDGAVIEKTLSVCPEIFLLASLLDRQDITNMWYDFKVNKLKTSLYSTRGVRDLLFYTPDTSSDEIIYDFPLDTKFGSVEIGVMKSGWNADNTYVASVGGKIDSHWDKGGFVFDALGERWAIELGKDDYNIEGGYFGEDGATIYRKRAEGHNVIVINPDEDAGQVFGASATLKKTCYGNLEAYHVYDLSDVYADDVTKAERGFYLGDARQTLTIQDEFSLKKDNSEVMWFMHTRADINVSEDGKSALLTDNGKQLKVEFLTNLTDWRVEKVAAEPLPSTPEREGQAENLGVTKIRMTGIGNGECYITAKLTPVKLNADYEPIRYVPISAWEVSSYDAQCALKVKNAYSLVLCEGMDVKLSAPKGFLSAMLYIDNSFIGTFTDSGANVHSYGGCMPQNIEQGSHMLTAVVRYPGHTDDIVVSVPIKVVGEIASSNVIDFEELDEATYITAESANSAVGWFKEITSQINGKAKIIIENDDVHGNVYTLKLLDGVNDIYAGESYAHIYARQNSDKTYVVSTKKGKVIFEFDIKLRGFWGASLILSPFSNDGNAHSSYSLVDYNVITGTNISLDSNYKWYHVEVIYDLDNLKVYGKFGDVELPVCDFVWADKSPTHQYLTYFRLGARAYGNVDDEPDYYSIDNIRTSYVNMPTIGYDGIAVTKPEITVSDGKAQASFVAESRVRKTVTAITAIYNDNALEDVFYEEIEINLGDGEYRTTPVVLPKNYSNVKCFVWECLESVTPINIIK